MQLKYKMFSKNVKGKRDTLDGPEVMREGWFDETT